MKQYQLDFKVCISKLGVNDQQINKLLYQYSLKNFLANANISFATAC